LGQSKVEVILQFFRRFLILTILLGFFVAPEAPAQSSGNFDTSKLTPQQMMVLRSMSPEEQRELVAKVKSGEMTTEQAGSSLLTGDLAEGPQKIQPDSSYEQGMAQEYSRSLREDPAHSAGDTRAADSIARLDSAESLEQMHTKAGLKRYSDILFSRSLPSAFSSTTNAVGDDYPLKAGDKVVLSVWGGPEQEISLALNNQGAVFVENGGWVSLNGLTLRQAEQKLRRVLKKSMVGLQLGTTKIALRLDELSPIKVFILGEVKIPGGYVFHGNTNVFMALYKAQGPTELGSVRDIQINRSGRKIRIDLYDFLFKGNKPRNSILKDGDIIYLPQAERIVGVRGAVGNPALYELSKGESMQDLLSYAGGVRANAAVQSILLTRFFEDGRRDVLTLDDPRSYANGKSKADLKDGDILQVFDSRETPEKIIAVRGEVKYPGNYEYKESATVLDLLEQAGGYTKDAWREQVQIFRRDSLGIMEVISVVQASISDFSLQPMDSVLIYSKNQMEVQDLVQIDGAVKVPENYPYYRSMTVRDLVALAGGFAPGAQKAKIRVERMIPDSRELQIILPMDQPEKLDMKLEPLDRVVVAYNPNFIGQQLVELTGAFKYTGEFALAFQGETLKEFIDRVGVLEETAYIKGGRFSRMRQGDTSRYYVSVDLSQAIAGGIGSEIELRAGDKIFIPQNQVSVQVYGEVVHPTDIMYKKGMNAWYYINMAGGLMRTSDEERIVIEYANGERSRLSDARRAPDEGAKIFVPFRPEPEPIDWVKVVSAVATILGATATTILAIATLKRVD